MAKRNAEPYAKRPFALEYYAQLTHKNPTRRGFCMNPVNALVAAGAHLDRGEYVMVVCVKRESGRVLWTRLRIGHHNIYRPGDGAGSAGMANVEVRW